jgi:4'-phosphopantetheinyl transferase
MVAVGHGGPVGVDVESVHRFDLPGLRAVVLHDSEEATDAADLARIWVRKEALLKATGEGLRVDPRSVRVSSPREPAALLEWGAESRARPVLYDVPVDQGHVAAVAVLGPAPLRLTTRRAAPGELAH